MKISILIAIFESYGAVARQVKYFHKMNLPDDIEFIFVDDGSDPPHNRDDYVLKNLTLLHTYDKRPWTQGLARNMGAKAAKGEYLFVTDIDQIISREAIEDVYHFTGDRMNFRRFFGVLLEDGTLTQESKVLEEYGMDLNRLKRSRKLYAGVHGNTYAIKKSYFDEIGGYDPAYCVLQIPQCGDESIINRYWNQLADARGLDRGVFGSPVYMFPLGRFHVNYDLNPKGLFHHLYDDFKKPR